MTQDFAHTGNKYADQFRKIDEGLSWGKLQARQKAPQRLKKTGGGDGASVS